MGNCLRKSFQNPSQPNSIASPPTGLNEFKVSHRQKASKAIEEMNSSVPSNTQKDVDEIQISHLRKMSKPLQEMNSSVPSSTQKTFNDMQVSHRGKIIKPLQEMNSSVSSSTKKEKLQQDGKYGGYGFSRKEKIKDELLHAYKLNCFCYNSLKDATNKFCKKNLLGQGGFGDVYKGWIDYCTMSAAKPGGGFPIAVKRLRKEGAQGCEEWLNELNFLSRLQHPNVVKLIGYCSEGKHRILVYEYMTKGSLEAHLLREGNTELNWSRRIKIAGGLARGLEYLHNAGRPVIHRDLKSSNILLDNGFNAKLSDFGLAKFGPQGDKTHISTRILGTRGYFAPEYIATGHLTLKTDVYSLGVVLLEILSGSGAVKRYSDGVAGELAMWARPYLSSKLEVYRVIDKRLSREDFRMEEAYGFAEIILHCLALKPEGRPTMTEVVRALEQLDRNANSYNQNQML